MSYSLDQIMREKGMQNHNDLDEHQGAIRSTTKRSQSDGDSQSRQHPSQGSNQQDNDSLKSSSIRTIQSTACTADMFDRVFLSTVKDPVHKVIAADQSDNSTNSRDDMSHSTHYSNSQTSIDFTPFEHIDVEVGNDSLGIELAADSTHNNVVVRSVDHGTLSKALDVQMLRRSTISSGFTINKINGMDVSEWRANKIFETLQIVPHPFVIRFRKNSVQHVFCKLCESRISVVNLDAHTNYCIKLKQHELRIEQINKDLERFANEVSQIKNVTHAVSGSISRCSQYAYNALLDSSVKVARCTASQVASVDVCGQLIKSLRFLCETVSRSTDDTPNRSLGHISHFSSRLHGLINAKILEMRATQKLMLQGIKYEYRARFLRTRSLEEQKSPIASVYHPSPCIVSIRDFDILKPISRGAFGRVYLARKKTTGDQFAIKVLGKAHVLRKKQLQNIETERDILMNVESPFVVKLFWTFQTQKNLFLVMEYLPGGDLMSLLECVVQLEEDVARIYIAEIAIALNHIHAKNCVHRDLKPDNILLSSTGHIKLTDFGLSEEGICNHYAGSDHVDSFECTSNTIQSTLSELASRKLSISAKAKDNHKIFDVSGKASGEFQYSYGRCGTPDYLSPEIILQQPHGSSVDYWALGVILYEMLVGFPPFNDNTIEAIFDNILSRNIVWPDGEKRLSDEATDLISGLLTFEPTDRINWQELKSHSFFEGIEWEKLLDSTPPFVPTLEGPNDTSYFNNRNLTGIFIDDDDDIPTKVVAMESEGIKLVKHNIPVANICLNKSKYQPLNDFSLCKNTTKTRYGLITSPIEGHKLGKYSAKSIEAAERCHKFPSGMYGEKCVTSGNQKFECFSVTNINALASASRKEAKVLTGTALNKVNSESRNTIIL